MRFNYDTCFTIEKTVRILIELFEVVSDDGSGREVLPSEVVGPARRGRKVAVFGDTSDGAEAERACAGCDLVVHEATMENALVEKAVEFGHSTPDMAAAFALRWEALDFAICGLVLVQQFVNLVH